jgi:hypothetical protein
MARHEPGGKKYDEGKLRYDLLPVEALQEVTKVLTLGATKYGDRNWEEGIVYGRLYAAAQRHLVQFLLGEPFDVELGTHHVANAIVNLLMMLQFELEDRGGVLDNLTKVYRLPPNMIKVAQD